MQPPIVDMASEPLLDLIPYGEIDSLALAVVAANLQAVAGLPTRVRSARPFPDEAFIATRHQFDAVKIVGALDREEDGAPFRMGVIQRDLCIPILTYVYGEAQLGGRAAVISLHRLRHIDRQITCERGAKIALHEAGHLLGLEHCREPGCLMRFSKQLDQLDHLPMRFCSSCEYEIVRLLRKLVHDRTGYRSRTTGSD